MDFAQLSAETIRALDLLGVVANALLAGALARGKRYDLIGFLILGIITGLGGGMIRDLLIAQYTPIALTDPSYLAAAVVGSLIAYVYPTTGRVWRRGARFVDAIALGTWGAVGAQRALAAGLSPGAAILLGTITGVGGGVLRDVLVRRTPMIFGGSTLYATCATAAAGVAVALQLLMAPVSRGGLTTIVGTLIGGGLCLLAYKFNWSLPEARDWRILTRDKAD